MNITNEQLYNLTEEYKILIENIKQIPTFVQKPLYLICMTDHEIACLLQEEINNINDSLEICNKIDTIFKYKENILLNQELREQGNIFFEILENSLQIFQKMYEELLQDIKTAALEKPLTKEIVLWLIYHGVDFSDSRLKDFNSNEEFVFSLIKQTLDLSEKDFYNKTLLDSIESCYKIISKFCDSRFSNKFHNNVREYICHHVFKNKYLIDILETKQLISFLHDGEITDRDFALNIIDGYPELFVDLSEIFRNDRDFVIEAINISPHIFPYLNKKFRADKDIALKAVSYDNFIEFVGISLMDDCEIALALYLTERYDSVTCFSLRIQALCQGQDPIEALTKAIEAEKLHEQLQQEIPLPTQQKASPKKLKKL